ncbi:KamA family radical SAM protein [Desulfurivibrio alkaliphilus]|uniref:Lysine 2,3-aminomutase YodO family protein n=1 Tax=Desulfurivibrio alkaliphilus (strain DSM 19089 / UNIQEM U267 / AHT2) TaxID=589865 RepID=D6Z6C9_DESAT|nr:KamA family radical SAM protein [Desulfurivibrio alkaliphilus]ADH86894.1 lysine 2,3-aminomutase YodO family protein [Desulfurivibrio alkaliphilus AHT 2]
MEPSIFTAKYLLKTNPYFFAVVREAQDLEGARGRLLQLADRLEARSGGGEIEQDAGIQTRIRDCVAVLRSMLKPDSEAAAGFSVAEALWDIARHQPRPELTPAFYAEFFYLCKGLEGQGPRRALDSIHLTPVKASGRPAARIRSRQLDDLWSEVDRYMESYPLGLAEQAVARRQARRERIIKELGADLDAWHDWRWQIRHIVRELETLEKLVKLSDSEREAVALARKHKLPFGITPYYLSLMDDELGGRDASIRAQVLPPMNYVQGVLAVKDPSCLDFMGEEDTSPFDLITRRYPAICILKPYNTCPQICVYCQRNWEIDEVMAPGAFAGMEKIKEAIDWIHDHPAIHEVLITGGDPLAMGNETLAEIIERVAAIPTVERIRLGTRTLVTMPMRFTEGLAGLIARHHRPGRREVAVMTHVQHPYEITPEMVEAVNRLRQLGIPVYNQLVYTFFISRRFEAACLRRQLRLSGIDPYYTFNTKGKDETIGYRVPIARLIQEQEEEARLLPGLGRTDEAVFNVPRQGKSYLRAREYRNLLAIKPNGARVYEFLSWEKKVSQHTSSYINEDVPILDYLKRLKNIGESISDYESIWYYY